MIRITSFVIVLSLLLLSFDNLKAQEQADAITIIPKPNSVSIHNGSFKLQKSTTVLYPNDSIIDVVKIIETSFKSPLKSHKLSTNVKSTNIIELQIEKGFSNEGYKLKITPQKISCQAFTNTGLFYAVQSLIQLIRSDNTFPCLVIEDAPLFSWRGFMLDESRHFMGKDVVIQYLNIMSKLKLNRFHWHLTDEQGWRIEIKQYPKLTTIGSIGNWSDSKATAQYYTQEDIREVVEYARQRHIMVIPEIDMPGHATAATKAYPELSGGGEGRWQGFTFNPAKESTYEFLDNVFSEIIDLFPAPYIHIGGDEVHFGNQSWYTDPDIQKFIKDNYLSNEVGLEHYFIRRVCDMINNKGKKMIGWDEIIQTGITPSKAVVMWWRHDKPELLTQALDKGFDIVLCPRIPCYFDFVQDANHTIGRRWDGNFSPLETVYSFPQNINTLIDKQLTQILGLQANMWTERVQDKKRLDFMIFPRLLAIAEDAWTEYQMKNYTDFEIRVKTFIQYLNKWGINYYNVFDPDSTLEPYGPEKEDVITEG